MKTIIYVNVMFLFFACNKQTKQEYKYPSNVIKHNKKEFYNNSKWLYFALIGERRAKPWRESDIILTDMDSLCISYDVYDDIGFVSIKDSGINKYWEYSATIGDSVLIYGTYHYSLKGYEPQINCDCHDYATIPEVFIFDKKENLVGTAYGRIAPQMNIEYIESHYNIKKRLADFPDIIRKHKDELNPWLYAEAQRRGIID